MSNMIKKITVHYSKNSYGFEDGEFTSFIDIVTDLQHYDNENLMHWFDGEYPLTCTIEYENGDITNAPLNMFICMKITFELK